MDRTFEPTFQLQWLDGERIVDLPLAGMPGEVFELVEEMRMITVRCKKAGRRRAAVLDGRWSVAMCLAAERSIERGEPVEIGES